MRAGPDLTVLACGHDVADARIHRLCTAFRRAGLEVEVLGLGRAEDGPDGCVVTATPRPGPAGRAALALRYAARARGSVVLAVDPDGLLAGRALCGTRGRRVVADVHEDYLALLRDRRWAQGPLGMAARALARLATRAAATADLTLVADEHVPPATARHRLVVPNLPDLGHLGTPTDPDRTPRAVYIGDVRASRGLFAMLDTVAAAPGWVLDVVGPVAAADEPALASRLAQDRDLEGRVRLHGRLTPARSWDVARGSWVGFALLEDTPAFRDAVPSKVHEYLAAGLVPVVTDLPRQAALVRDRGGVVVASAEEAAAALRALAEDPAELARRRAAALGPSREAGPSAYDEAADAVRRLL